MSSLRRSDTDRPGSYSNFNVDFVIHYHVPEKEKEQAEASFVQLVENLTKAGFATEVRYGEGNSLLLFLKIASDKLLRQKLFKYRIQDWLFSVRTTPPNKDLGEYFRDEPVTDAERLRMAYMLITSPKSEGGAGVTPKKGQWKYVGSVFPLHDHAFNRQWLKEWSTKYVLGEDDVDQIREKFGEQVAFYFAFLQSYFTFLIFPSAFGFGAWLILGQFSWLYAALNCLWSIVFFEYWKKKEVDLAVQWGVRGVSRIQQPRPQFRWESEITDSVTGETRRLYSPFKRLARQLLQVPFTLACAAILGSVIAGCFAIEIFISEVYAGPFKTYLEFLPTLILTASLPLLSTALTKLAEKLTEVENYETHDEHNYAFVQKIFVLNFIVSYLPIFLTAFVYVPFGAVLVPYLDIFEVTAQKFTTEGQPLSPQNFQVDPNRLTQQVIYQTVTAQIVNFATETIVPFIKRAVFQKAKDIQSERNREAHPKDQPEEADFLSRVRNEATLSVYDVTVDYREMVVQFGHLSLFSAVWPLGAFCFLVNNWVEARSDAAKIAIGSQRPIPWRSDSIGPWLPSIGFLSWMGSLVSTAIVFLFQNDPHGPDGSPSKIPAVGLLLSILFAEHVYLLLQLVIRYVLGKMDSPGLRKERTTRFATRKRLLQETLGNEEAAQITDLDLGGGSGEKITREALEEEAREASTQGHGTPEQAFWLRQRSASETIQIGRMLISETASAQKVGLV